MHDRDTARLRAIFLDAGGTIIHMDRDFVIESLVRHGVSCDESRFIVAEHEALRRIRAQVRSAPHLTDAARWRTAWAAVLAGLGCDGATAAAVAADVRRRHARGGLWTRVLPGTAEALAVLRRRGYVLGVVSNADGRVEQFLETAGLRDRLDFVVDSTVVGVEKPDPRIFEIACERAGVRPDEALHVGDIYEIDVLGARAAGIEAVLVTAQAPADRDCAAIPAVHALPEWLRRGHEAA